jgi:hypothetical protein
MTPEDLFAVLPFLLGAACIALVVCVLCHRHHVLLWLGGLLALPTGWLLLSMSFYPQYRGGSASPVVAIWTFLAGPPLAAGVVLLVGGVVRWDRTRSRGPGALAGSPPERGDDPGPGGRSGH